MKKLTVMLFLLVMPMTAFCEDLKLISFADALFDGGDYYRAIGEYKRYVFYNPSGKFVKKSAYRIGMSYLYAGKLEEAAPVFEKIQGDYTGAVAEAAVLAEAWTYFTKKDWQYSSTVAGKLAAGPLKARAEYLGGLNLINMKQYGEAGGVFEKLADDKELGGSSAALAAFLKKSNDIPQRNAVLSSVFSAILPGAGYAYCGKWVEGIVSLALNAFFIYNTYNAFANNDNAAKYGYGVPAAVFYFSGIYGSAGAASRFNEEEEGKFINGALELKTELVSADF